MGPTNTAPLHTVNRAAAISHNQSHSFSSFLSSNKTPNLYGKSVAQSDNVVKEISINKSNTLSKDVPKLIEANNSIKEKVENNVQSKKKLSQQNNDINIISSSSLANTESLAKQQKESIVENSSSKSFNL